MKKLYTLLLTVFLLNSASAQLRSTKDLLGRWEYNQLKFQFFSNGRMGLVMQGGAMPGATYTVDFQKNPHVLSISVTNNEKVLRYNALLKFLDNNTIQLTWLNDKDPGGFNQQVFKLNRMDPSYSANGLQ